MDCYKGKIILFMVILNLSLEISNSAPVSDEMESNPNMNGKKLMEIGKKLNLPKLQMIGKAIETVKNEIEAKMTFIEEKLGTKICGHHPCSDWTEWSRCNPVVDKFGSKFRTRDCIINKTICDKDSERKIDKEIGLCFWCPEGYNLTKNGFCLKFVTDKKMVQNDAEKQCQKDGGHLVNIDSEVKYEDISSILAGFTYSAGIWIDGRRKDVSSPWKYMYGSQKGFFKWHSGEPDENPKDLCLIVARYYKNPSFFDAYCTSGYYYMCEIVKTL